MFHRRWFSYASHCIHTCRQLRRNLNHDYNTIQYSSIRDSRSSLDTVCTPIPINHGRTILWTSDFRTAEPRTVMTWILAQRGRRVTPARTSSCRSSTTAYRQIIRIWLWITITKPARTSTTMTMTRCQETTVTTSTGHVAPAKLPRLPSTNIAASALLTTQASEVKDSPQLFPHYSAGSIMFYYMKRISN